MFVRLAGFILRIEACGSLTFSVFRGTRMCARLPSTILKIEFVRVRGRVTFMLRIRSIRVRQVVGFMLRIAFGIHRVGVSSLLVVG